MEMTENEAGIQLAMTNMKKEVGACRKTAKKVDNMDVMLKVKITILNQLNKTVGVHGEAI